jgi:hypothetical protein
LQDALAAAAEEITVELAPGSVEVRLRGREPEFVVTPPPTDPAVEDREDENAAGWDEAPRLLPEGEELAVSRINLRLPEHLKSRIERAAAAEGLSVNSWLVRSSAAALGRADPTHRPQRRTPRGRQRYSGWAR